ncbi:MAG TPA: NifU family protein [Bacteroidetes bacterium]|nr:NifU family protein [Bacteroidota bacterium]
MTPNPETMKFVTNKILLLDNYVEFKDIESATDSPLAIELFAFPFVKGVFFMNNFVTVTKDTSADWMEISIPIKDFLKNYFDEGKAVFSTNFKLEKPVEEKSISTSENETEIVSKIKEMLENYIKPAVEMDGGAIQFKSFNAGKVSLLLQGSCSGCPSSTITLKAGIEGLLKRMIPEVQEVVAEAE